MSKKKKSQQILFILNFEVKKFSGRHIGALRSSVAHPFMKRHLG